jgi:hypothetical protein
VKFAVLRLYEKGARTKKPLAEAWGDLAIARDDIKRAVRATLKIPGSTQYERWLIPPLFDVAFVRCDLDVLQFRGVENIGGAWHLQVWSCRLATHQEVQSALASGDVGYRAEHAQYRHWWPRLVAEVRKDKPGTCVVTVKEAVRTLEISVEEVWGFLEWICATRRGYVARLGTESLGEITIQNLGTPTASEVEQR